MVEGLGKSNKTRDAAATPLVLALADFADFADFAHQLEQPVEQREAAKPKFCSVVVLFQECDTCFSNCYKGVEEAPNFCPRFLQSSPAASQRKMRSGTVLF